MSIQKHTFEGVLNYLATKESPKWHIYLQASQFELNGFKDSTNFGTLCLNFGPHATRNMVCHDDCVTFNTMKHGIEQFMSVPYTAMMFIQDPDNPNAMLPWPYYLDHGDDSPEVPDNVIPFTPREAWDTANGISNKLAKDYLDAPGLKTHSDGAQVIDMVEFKATRQSPEERTISLLKEQGLVDDNGNLDLIALAQKAAPIRAKAKDEQPLTIQEKIAMRNWSVIEGGNQKPEASMPFFDEIYHAKRERRESDMKLAKINLNAELGTHPKALRSDGNDGTSVFFPDLDVSKCYFPTKRIERPSWMTVINGGKDVEA